MTEAQGELVIGLLQVLALAAKYQLVMQCLLLGAVFVLCYQGGRKGGK